MAHAHHFHDDLRIVDGVGDAVHALPYPIELAAACELFAARRSRVVTLCLPALQVAPHLGFGHAAQVFRNRRIDTRRRV